MSAFYEIDNTEQPFTAASKTKDSTDNLTLRDQIAIKIVSGQQYDHGSSPTAIAWHAYKVADEMIRLRDIPPGQL